MTILKISRVAILLATTFTVISCTHAKTWELENLKKPEMSLNQSPLENKVSDHIHHSKETASSISVGTSGCSCY